MVWTRRDWTWLRRWQDEVRLTQSLLERHNNPNLRLYLLDIGQPLLCAAYRYAAEVLADCSNVSVCAIRGTSATCSGISRCSLRTPGALTQTTHCLHVREHLLELAQ